MRLVYHDFGGAPWVHLVRWLYARLHLANERPIELFDLATQKLIQRKVILPGPTTLARLIVRVRERVNVGAFSQVARKLTPLQQTNLEDLLLVPPGQRLSTLEQLRTPPTAVSARGLHRALERQGAIRKLGLADLDLGDVPPGRLSALRRDGLTEWASTIARMPMPRRYATLLVAVQDLEGRATDDVLDVFDAHMTALGVKGEQQRRKERLRTLRDLDSAALLLCDALRMVRDPDQPEAGLRQRLDNAFGADALTLAELHVTELASDIEDGNTEAWLYAQHSVSSFLAALLRGVVFDGTPGVKPLLDALTFLKSPRPAWRKAPTSFVPRTWERAVLPLGDPEPNRRTYALCAAHLLHEALKRREMFVPRSSKYGDPRAKLLQGEAWNAVKLDVQKALDLPDQPAPYVEQLGRDLDTRYRDVVGRLNENAFVRVVNGVPIITPLEALPDPPSYTALDKDVSERLPVIDLSELLLEVNAFAPIVDAIVETVDGRPRRGDLATSVAAVLVAEACNIGLKAVSRSNVAPLTLGRLAFVKQHYVRADALLKANAVLVEAQSELLLAQRWGGTGRSPPPTGCGSSRLPGTSWPGRTGSTSAPSLG